MRFREQKPDYFDVHRKDHSGRPILISAAFLSSLAIWALLIVGVAKLF
jgi:hypothetical protein